MTDNVITLDQERTKRRPHQTNLHDLALAWAQIMCRTGPDTDPDDALIAEGESLFDGLISTPATTTKEAVYKGAALYASILKFHESEDVVSCLCLALVEDLQQMSRRAEGASSEIAPPDEGPIAG